VYRTFVFVSSSTFSLLGAAQTRCWRLILIRNFRSAGKMKTPFRTSRCAKYQRATSKIHPSRFRLAGDKLLGLAMACSLRDSQQGLRVIASPDPTNQLPNSLSGQAIRPPGGSTAHLQLSKSSITTLHPQVVPLFRFVSCDFQRVA